MTKQFADKVLMITGAATGIGRATAVEFANQGAKVAITDIKDNGAEHTVEILKKIGAEVIHAQIDVANKNALEDFAARIENTFGGID